MKIEVSTDTRVESTSSAISKISEAVEAGLQRFRDRLTRVEVHLSDINGPRGGLDRRCVLEVRPASMQPVAVDHQAETDETALKGAVEKMTRLLTSTFGRQDSHRGGSSASGLPT